MSISLTLSNPCKTRILRLSVEEKRDGEWTLVDARLLAPGEKFEVILQRDKRRTSLQEVSTQCAKLIASLA